MKSLLALSLHIPSLALTSAAKESSAADYTWHRLPKDKEQGEQVSPAVLSLYLLCYIITQPPC
jgi:hypothetical protein